MPTAKRQRVSLTTKRAALSSSITSQKIGAFTHVSKTGTTAKSTIDKNHSIDATATAYFEETTIGKKRRLLGEEATQIIQNITASDERKIKAVRPKRSPISHLLPKTPQKSIVGSETTPVETPIKGAASLLDRLFLFSKTPTRSSLSSTFTSPSILTSTPTHHTTSPQHELPAELLDLINLHAAFLTALSLHYAHNGTTSPSDLRMLCPDIARAWGKRRVTLEDIRRSMGLTNTNIPENTKHNNLARLSLSDYGYGKICIETRIARGKGGNMARPVDEDLMNDIFERGLKAEWEKRNSNDVDVMEFIGTLPMEPITTCSSLRKMSPLLAKGQRRLEDMKVLRASKESVMEKVLETTLSRGPKLTLLERLRAKQLQQSNLPPPPTKAELNRKAALQRMEEVIAVLTVLSTSSSIGQSRISFTIPTVLSKLRDSFRRALSKEEAELCVRLLASDITSEWVRIVKMGNVEALVVIRDQRPGDAEIRERIKRAS